MKAKAVVGVVLGAAALVLSGCDYRGAPDYYGYIREPSYPDYGGYLASPVNRGYPGYSTYYAPPVPPGAYSGGWRGPR